MPSEVTLDDCRDALQKIIRELNGNRTDSAESRLLQIAFIAGELSGKLGPKGKGAAAG